ncbi:MAG: trimethylamine methyltransferase family protein [Candidatus Thorarchaeota archaeon]
MTKLRILSKDGISSVHMASLEVLERTGVLVKSSNALKILKDAGCEIDSNIVKIPPNLVEDALEKVPSSFQLYTREGNKCFTVGGDEVIYNPGSTALQFLDRTTGEIRRATLEDLIHLVKLVDGLEYLQAQSTAVVPGDVPDTISDLYRLYVILKESTKPIVTGAFSTEGLLDMIRMLEAVAGTPEDLAHKPRAIFDCCPSSPLMWSDVTAQNLIDCSKHDVPAEIVPAPLMGVTSPVTVTGTLVQSNAEVLSGVVISQLVREGSPVVYGAAPMVLDMKRATPCLGAVEAMMVACATAEIGKHYGMPTHAYLGVSDSKVVDAQSGLESGLGIALGALARINVVSGPGMLASVNCQSLEKLVIDNELCGLAYRLIEDIRLESSDLAVDLIKSVGPGGYFLEQEHTRAHFRKELFIPSDILCRLSPESWKDAGAKDAFERARESVDHLLSEHVPTPLSQETEKRLDGTLQGILKRHGIPRSKLPMGF